LAKRNHPMIRVRLASLVLAGGLFALSGCATSWDFLSRWRPCAPGCECDDVVTQSPPNLGCSTGVCPGGPLVSGIPPTVVQGPNLFPPSPTQVIVPGGVSPRPNPLPPVVTIPQAIPSPSPP
jgi:hypothetical protein